MMNNQTQTTEQKNVLEIASKEDLKEAISVAHNENELSKEITIDNLDKWSDEHFDIVSEYLIELSYDIPDETWQERVDDLSDAFSNYPDKPRPQQ